MQVNATSMTAHTNWLASNSNNIANVNTNDYKATDTTLNSNGENSVDATFSKSDSSTQLEKELTEQIPIERGFEANTKAIQTEEQMIGSLIDLSI
jgi:flagellar hook protein FlgE